MNVEKNGGHANADLEGCGRLPAAGVFRRTRKKYQEAGGCGAMFGIAYPNKPLLFR
jgi:hypothetical protein